MNGVSDISTVDLAIAFASLSIPIAVFVYYKVKLIKDVLISAVRMIIQLALVSIYLEWIFKLNSAVLNLTWVLLMIIVGVITSINRIKLNWKIFVIPFFIAGLSSIIIIDSFFLGFVVKLKYIFDARYFIPITGMILGNSMNHNIVGLTNYFGGLTTKTDLYYFLLTNSGNKKLALRPYISEAIIKGLNPLIATMSVIGLISLPGMMTGQILGGSSPLTAIKYQIMIMLAIFVGCTINLVLSIIFSNYFIFDNFGRVRKEVFKK